MTEHIPEKTLERFAVDITLFDAEAKSQVTAHIDHCSLCSENLARWRTLYENASRSVETPPTERDRVLARKLIGRRGFMLPFRKRELPAAAEQAIDAYFEAVEPYRRPLAQRIARYVVKHPGRTAGSFSIAAALLLTLFLSIRQPTDSNPAYTSVRNEILVTYNSVGQELWRKNLIGCPDDTLPVYPNLDIGEARVAYVADVDGDGRNEILITGRAGGMISGGTLVCFEADGGLRWRHQMGNVGIKFGSLDFTHEPSWEIARVRSIRRTLNDKPQIFVSAQLVPSWPCKLVELDPTTGNEKGTFWHAGAMGRMLAADVDGDGVQELVVGGITNTFNSACVMVFDPRNVDGAGPTAEGFEAQGIGRGTEKFYLLLPRSSLGEALAYAPYNGVRQMTISDQGQLTLQTEEGQTTQGSFLGGFVYSFTRNMAVGYVVANDPFVVSFNRAKRDGLISDTLDTAYYQRLKDAVRYWDGEKFVSKVTVNSLYAPGKEKQETVYP